MVRPGAQRRVEGRAAEALRLRSLRLRAQGERNRRIRARSRPPLPVFLLFAMERGLALVG